MCYDGAYNYDQSLLLLNMAIALVLVAIHISQTYFVMGIQVSVLLVDVM